MTSSLGSRRILYALRSSPFVLGVQRHVLDLAHAFSQQGIQTIIASNPVPFAGELSAAAGEWLPLTSRGGLIGLGTLGFQLRRIVATHDIDVIHSHHRFVTTAARLFVPDVPLIHTAHNVFTSHRRTTLLGDHVIAVSEAVRRNVVDYFGVRAESVVTIYNGVRPVAAPASPPEIDRPFTLLCPARLEPAKGHSTLFRALRLLRDEGLSIRTVLAGSGSLETQLRSEIQRLDLSDQVEFVGHQRDPNPLYAAADAIVLASDQEGLPYALLEAAMHAKPAIATAVGGVPEIIQDRSTGLLVACGDASGLATAIRTICVDSDLRDQLGSRAREFASARFSFDSMLQRTAEQYSISLARTPAAQRAVAEPRRIG